MGDAGSIPAVPVGKGGREMKRYRKKIAEVEALRIFSNNTEEIRNFAGIELAPEYAKLIEGNYVTKDKNGNTKFWDRDAFLYHFEEIEPDEIKSCNGIGESRKKILDGLREIKEVCKKNVACHECPIRNVCRLIDPFRTGDNPSNWKSEDIENAI